MNIKKYLPIITAILFLGMVFLDAGFAQADGEYQQPTIAIPTVTGTPRGVIATVNINREDAINVRNGPSVLFDLIGTIQPGQQVPVLGRSVGGDWILIEYFGGPENQGWIYAPFVTLSPGEIPIIEPPPTPTPELTQTVNPTLAAQFINTPVPTRLATFTPVEPLVIPTYEDVTRVSLLGRIPMGLVILVIGGLGALLSLFSFISER